jgi:uncharacterized protein DUF1801
MTLAEDQLKSCIGKFDAKTQALIRATRRAMRKALATASELVYDNYNFFVIGYSRSERPSDAFVSIAAAANGVSLMFLRGAGLPDPHKLLRGTGKLNRSLKINSANDLDRHEVRSLISEAAAQAGLSLTVGGKPKLIIRSVSKKQRPRKHTTSSAARR